MNLDDVRDFLYGPLSSWDMERMQGLLINAAAVAALVLCAYIIVTAVSKTASFMGRWVSLMRKSYVSLRRDMPMTAKERREQQACGLMDAIADHIERQRFNEKWTYEEAWYWYDRVAKATGMYQLMRTRDHAALRTPNLIQQHILKRKLRMFQSCKHKDRKVIPFPDAAQRAAKVKLEEPVVLAPAEALAKLMPGYK